MSDMEIEMVPSQAAMIDFIQKKMKASASDKAAMIQRIKDGDGNLKAVVWAMMRKASK